MHILITGGAGFIGSHMVLDCVDRGLPVVVLDDLSNGIAKLVPSGVPLVIGDIADVSLVRDIIAHYQVDTVAHFAAKIVVPESVSDPLGYYLTNVSKARTLFETAIKANVRKFIFSSTAAVYGDSKSEPVTEETQLQPMSPYGRSKLMVEWMLEDAARAFGIETVILRYFNVAGADPKLRSGQCTKGSTHLIKVACEVSTGRRESMAIYGTDYPTPDGTCIRDYIHVSDLARAHGLALDYLRQGGKTCVLNCAYGHGSSVREVINTVKRVSGMDFPVIESPRRDGDPPSIVATGERVRSVLNWQPRYDDLDMIVSHALAWERRLNEMSIA